MVVEHSPSSSFNEDISVVEALTQSVENLTVRTCSYPNKDSGRLDATAWRSVDGEVCRKFWIFVTSTMVKHFPFAWFLVFVTYKVETAHFYCSMAALCSAVSAVSRVRTSPRAIPSTNFDSMSRNSSLKRKSALHAVRHTAARLEALRYVVVSWNQTSRISCVIFLKPLY